LNINTIKSTYGYIGFIPFAVLSITPWITGGYIGKTAIIFQIAYGSIILTFLGGISWGWRDDQPQQKKNLSIGDNILIDSKQNIVISESRLVAAVGISDTVIIETKDAVLVTTKEKSEDVKKLVDCLKENDRDEFQWHREVHRPWGKYDSIDSDDGFQVKRITVNPGAKLSVQMHYHRSEHWVVVSGKARVHYGDEYRDLNINESTYHDKEVVHALENIGDSPMILIEVQIGDYLGEDDIVRFDDIYGRS